MWCFPDPDLPTGTRWSREASPGHAVLCILFNTNTKQRVDNNESEEFMNDPKIHGHS